MDMDERSFWAGPIVMIGCYLVVMVIMVASMGGVVLAVWWLAREMGLLG